MNVGCLYGAIIMHLCPFCVNQTDQRSALCSMLPKSFNLEKKPYLLYCERYVPLCLKKHGLLKVNSLYKSLVLCSPVRTSQKSKERKICLRVFGFMVVPSSFVFNGTPLIIFLEMKRSISGINHQIPRN